MLLWIFRGLIAKSKCVFCTKPLIWGSKAEISVEKLLPTTHWRFLSMDKASGKGRSRGGPKPDTFSSLFWDFLWFPLLLCTECQFVLCSALAGPVCGFFFSPQHFKSQLIFLDRPRGDNNVGFFPPLLSINKASEKKKNPNILQSIF